MQKMSRKQIGKYIQRIGDMLSENYRLSLIMECRTYLDIIAQHGQPSDTFSLLAILATVDQSEPLMLRINKILQTIVTLITKPTVRKQWIALEKEYKWLLRGDWCTCTEEVKWCPCCCQHQVGPQMRQFLTLDRLPILQKKFPIDQAAHLLGIASFDPNGYIRQTALQEIAKLETDAVLPYLLLRLHDWVPEVRAQAQITLQRLLESHKISLKQLIWCRPLLENFSSATLRVDLKPMREVIFSYIKQFESNEVVKAFKEAIELQDKKFLFNIFEGASKDDSVLINCMLTDKSPGIRWWLLKEDIFEKAREKKTTATYLNPANKNYKKYIESLAQDKTARVRYYALWHIEKFVPKNEQFAYQHLFINALTDKNYNVRKLASSFLKDPAQHLNLHTIKPKEVTSGFLKALGELDVTDAINFVENYFSDEQPALHSAALYAADLLGVTLDNELLKGLTNQNAQVRKTVVAILSKEKYIHLKKDIEKLLNDDNEHVEAKIAALKILIATSRYERILYILQALKQKEIRLKKRGQNYFTSWKQKYCYVRQYAYSDTNCEIVEKISTILLTLYQEGYQLWSELPLFINTTRLNCNLERLDFSQPKNQKFYHLKVLSVKQILQENSTWADKYSFGSGCPQCGTNTLFVGITVSNIDKNLKGIFQTTDGTILVDDDIAYVLSLIGYEGFQKVFDQQGFELPYLKIRPDNFKKLPYFAKKATGYTVKNLCSQCQQSGYFLNPTQELKIVYQNINPDILKEHILKTTEHFGPSAINRDDLKTSVFPKPALIISQAAAKVLQQYCDPKQFVLIPVVIESF